MAKRNDISVGRKGKREKATGKAESNSSYKERRRSKKQNLFSLEAMDYGEKFGLRDIKKAERKGATDNEISEFVKTLEDKSLTRAASNMYKSTPQGETKQNENYEEVTSDPDKQNTDETYSSKDAKKLIAFFQSEINRQKAPTQNVRGDVEPTKVLDARTQQGKILKNAGVQDFNTMNDADALIDFYSQKLKRGKEKEDLDSFSIGPKSRNKFDEKDFKSLMNNKSGEIVGNYASSLAKGDVTKAMERLLGLNKNPYES